MIWPGRRLLPGVAAAAGMEAGFAVSGADPRVKVGGFPRTAAVSMPSGAALGQPVLEYPRHDACLP